MYKFVIPDTKRKQNDFFEIFWNIDQVLVALITWLLKLKYMLTHIFDFLSYENTIWFFVVLRLGHMHENKIFFLFFATFRWKPDSYPYDIKIQTDTNQNGQKNMQKNHKFSKWFF